MKVQNITLSSLAALIIAAAPAGAEKMPEGRQLAELAFMSVDADENGSLSRLEVLNYGTDALVSMDYDENGSISLEEFTGWDFGFIGVAEDSDKVQGLETAQKFLFDFIDRNDDQKFNADELNQTLSDSYDYSDVNTDGSMSKDEYLRGFIFNIAYRSALRQDQ